MAYWAKHPPIHVLLGALLRGASKAEGVAPEIGHRPSMEELQAVARQFTR